MGVCGVGVGVCVWGWGWGVCVVVVGGARAVLDLQLRATSTQAPMQPTMVPRCPPRARAGHGAGRAQAGPGEGRAGQGGPCHVCRCACPGARGIRAPGVAKAKGATRTPGLPARARIPGLRSSRGEDPQPESVACVS